MGEFWGKYSNCISSRAAITKYQSRWLTQQKSIASEFWRLEVQDQSVGKARSFWGLSPCLWVSASPVPSCDLPLYVSLS